MPDQDKAECIAKRLHAIVRADIGGDRDEDTVREVRALAGELRSALADNALSLRIGSLVREVETLCSPGKWRRAGLEHHLRIAREDAYVIMTHV